MKAYFIEDDKTERGKKMTLREAVMEYEEVCVVNGNPNNLDQEGYVYPLREQENHRRFCKVNRWGWNFT